MDLYKGMEITRKGGYMDKYMILFLFVDQFKREFTI